MKRATTITPEAMITINGSFNVIECIRVAREDVYIYRHLQANDRAYFSGFMDALGAALDDAEYYLSRCQRASRNRDFLTEAVNTLRQFKDYGEMSILREETK